MKIANIYDPGGKDFVRMVVCNSRTSRLTDGILLNVPEGAVCIVAVNGKRQGVFPPGRYSLNTGESPVLYDLRNFLSGGDPCVTVSAAYISTPKTIFLSFGTGELYVNEKQYHLTTKVMAPCTAAISISSPEEFFDRLIGADSQKIDMKELEANLTAILRTSVNTFITRALQECSVAEFNLNLIQVSEAIRDSVAKVLWRYGLTIESFSIGSVNADISSVTAITNLQNAQALASLQLELYIKQLNELYHGNSEEMVRAYALTGTPLPSLSVQPTALASETPAAAALPSPPPMQGGGMMNNLLQYMLLQQVMPARFPGQQQDMWNPFGSPPPAPKHTVQCNSCQSMISENAVSCPVCGASNV